MMPLSDPTLRLAIAAVVALTLFTLTFMGYALLLHLRSVRMDRKRRQLEERWKGPLLEAATGGDAGDVEALERDGDAVAPEDRVLFLELVTDYARAIAYPERRSLERRGEPYLSALDPLLRDRDPYRRAYALDILGELGYEQGHARIVAGLRDPSALVAMVAARALARQGDPVHVPMILERLGTFANWSEGYLASLLTSFGPGAAPALRDLMRDTDADERFRSVAARALAELNDVPAVDPAAALLPHETDVEVRADLIRLVGKLGGPEHLEGIRPFARDRAPHIRAVALRAISNLSDGRSSDVELVTEGLDDPSPWVALQAARGLGALGRDDELHALAGSPSPRAALALEVLEAGG